MLAKTLTSIVLLVLPLLASANAQTEIGQLQSRWAQVNYEFEGDAQLEAFEELAEAADSAVRQFPDSAGLWIWSGIIKSTYAGAKGGLGALGLAKAARRDLEKAVEIDADALDGSAYASLGTLYFSVPGWPVGFGNDKKAEELLQTALTLNPDSIDNNYFYASFLVDQQRFDEARQFLHRAAIAPPRPNRPLADSGRQMEIKATLEEIQGKH